MATYARFVHQGQTQTVALYEGLQTDELITLLKTIFGITADIVGILAEKGLVIPMSLVARSPQVVPNTVCQLLVKGMAVQPQQAETAQRAVAQASAESDEEDDEEEDVTEEESIAYVTSEIKSFLSSLLTQHFLSPAQHKLLLQLLEQNATLLFAAYSVALSAADSEYMAEICKDLGTSLQTQQGREACEAQDEVLQVCDQLYTSSSITENQLLYLRHLVLIRDEAVAAIYDDFQEHNSVRLLAEALAHLANTHPFQTREEEGGKSVAPTAQSGKSAQSTFTPDLSGIVSLMLRTQTLSQTEASVLLDLLAERNDILLGAYEVFRRDGRMDELQDTLLRCVRLEMRKRAVGAREAERDQEEQDDDEEDESSSSSSSSSGSSQGSNEEGSEEEDIPFTIKDISLSAILSSLGLENRWTAPEAFLKAIFIAVIHRQLSLAQGTAACDLYAYDLIQAAWEVFQVQEDEDDFIDSVRRIVRDVSEGKSAAQSGKSAQTQGKSASAQSGKSAQSAPSSQSSSTSSNASPKSATAMAEELIASRRQDALKAVQAAKGQLLIHSVEMLVKQGLLAQSNAQSLLDRYAAGDAMVDAAIETYASDRDVVEFLDTLQILGNNSQEELSDLMAAAEADNNASPSPSTSASAPSPSQDELAFVQMTDIVHEMARNEMIGPNITQAFTDLIAAKDSKLLKAYGAYLVTKNGADLVDSMLRIVIATVEHKVKEPLPTAAASAPAAATPGMVPVADQKTVINILLRSKALSPEAAERLLAGVDRGDREVQGAFRGYMEHKDIYRLMEDLKKVGNAQQEDGEEEQEDEEQDYEDQQDDDQDQDDDQEDGEEEEQGLDEDDRGSLETRFLAVIHSMSLTDLETAALRLAIAKDNRNVRMAIESYRGSGDEDALKARLVQVAREIIRETLEEDAEDEEEDEEEGDEEEDDEEDEEDASEEESEDEPVYHPPQHILQHTQQQQTQRGSPNRISPTKSPVKASPAKSSPTKSPSSPQYDYDLAEDASSEEESSTPVSTNHTSQAARRHVLPILLKELVREAILTPREGKAVLGLFADGDAAVGRALDSYDADSNMGNLVEALQAIVSNI